MGARLPGSWVAAQRNVDNKRTYCVKSLHSRNKITYQAFIFSVFIFSAPGVCSYLVQSPEKPVQEPGDTSARTGDTSVRTGATNAGTSARAIETIARTNERTNDVQVRVVMQQMAGGRNC